VLKGWLHYSAARRNCTSFRADAADALFNSGLKPAKSQQTADASAHRRLYVPPSIPVTLFATIIRNCSARHPQHKRHATPPRISEHSLVMSPRPISVPASTQGHVSRLVPFAARFACSRISQNTFENIRGLELVPTEGEETCRFCCHLVDHLRSQLMMKEKIA
jgi:hypothetical protein